jgi:hypothetical protein
MSCGNLRATRTLLYRLFYYYRYLKYISRAHKVYGIASRAILGEVSLNLDTSLADSWG